jgi:hypothetical protein
MKKKRKKVIAKGGTVAIERRDWAAFCVGYHGRGAHKSAKTYTRKSKHRLTESESKHDRDE